MGFDVSFSGWATALIAPLLVPFLSILIPYVRISREEKLLVNPNIQIFAMVIAEIGKLILILFTLLVVGSFEIQGHLKTNRFPFISDFRFSTSFIYFSITLTAILLISLLLLRCIKRFRFWVFSKIDIDNKSKKYRTLIVVLIIIVVYASIFFPLFLAGNTLGVILFYFSKAFELNIASTIEVVGYMFSTIPKDYSIFLIVLYLILYAAIRIFYGQLLLILNLLVSTQIIAHIKLINNEMLSKVSIIKTSIDGSSILVKNNDNKENKKILVPKSSILYIKFESKQVINNRKEEINDDTTVSKEVASTTESNVKILLPPNYK